MLLLVVSVIVVVRNVKCAITDVVTANPTVVTASAIGNVPRPSSSNLFYNTMLVLVSCISTNKGKI